MATSTVQLTGQLARAARALVSVSSKHVSLRAGLTRSQVRDFEKGNASLLTTELTALQHALEALGAVFIADGENLQGHGVHLKFSAARVEKIETWEGEGGFAADDDV